MKSPHCFRAWPHCFRALVVWLLLTSLGRAQEEPAKKPSSQPGAAVEELVRLYLMDGSVLAGKLSTKEILVETQFGKLSVPITAIRSFTPGMKSHPQLQADVNELIENLGAEEFGVREQAQKALLRLGVAVRKELQRRLDDKDTERQTRIKNILNDLEATQDEEDDDGESEIEKPLIDRDTVETTEFTIVGEIRNESFAIESRYGMLTVKLGDVKRMERDTGEQHQIRKSFSVEGAHLVQRSFKSSKIRVARGDRITVTAEGTITMTPWGNNALSTPDGAGNFGWYLANKIACGALVARIGKNGDVFKIGSRHSFTAKGAGVLYFAIAMSPGQTNSNFPGRYRLKIKLNR